MRANHGVDADGRGGALLIDVDSGVVTGQLELEQPQSWSYVRDVVFSPDGRRLAATRDRNNGGDVLIWNPATKENVCTLETAFDGATDLSFSPDGKLLAGGDDAGGVRIWHVGTWKPVGKLSIVE
jgi:WD40 repeat protein